MPEDTKPKTDERTDTAAGPHLTKQEFATASAALRAWAPGAPKPGEIEGDPLLATGGVESLISKLKGLVHEEKNLSPEEQQKRHQESYEKQARAQMQKHAADTTHRESIAEVRRQENERAGDIQPGNPGPGQPALVTEAAKRLGIRPEGREPAQVTGDHK